MTALLLLLAGALAAPADFLGMPVASVVVDAPRGGLPEESLEPLLAVHQGGKLTAADMRRDLATLMRVGEFAAVEAHAEHWVLYDDNGDPVPAVELTYRVIPAARVDRVRLQGVTQLKRRDVLDMAAVSAGDVFFPDIDGPSATGRVEALYKRRGFPNVVVEVDAVDLGDNQVEVWVRVYEGDPLTVDDVRFVGELPMPEWRLRNMARQEGVRPRKPLSQEALARARVRLQDELRILRTGVFGLDRRGWVQARVTPALTVDGEDTVVSFTVEAGPRLALEVSGVGGLTPRSTVEDALGLSSRPRLTAGFLAEAPEKLEAAMAEAGYRRAEATVQLDQGEDVQTLRVQVERGPRSVVESWSFPGATVLTESELALVFRQSSPVLAARRVTRPALERGVQQAERVYASRGYEDARLTVRDIQGVRRLSVVIDVEEGARTDLTEVTLAGLAHDAWAPLWEEQRASLAQGPYSPQALAALADTIQRHHRDEGYLDATVRVVTSEDETGRVAATIAVEPGPRVLLRAVLIRGAHGTDPGLVRRQVVGELGQPITPEVLEQTRRNLYSLGIFRTVDTRLVGEEPGVRDLLVTLVERDAWGFEAGVGLSTDQGILLTFRGERRNLLRRAHKLELYAQLGLDYRGDTFEDWSLDVEDPEYRGALTWTAPQFPTTSEELVIDLLAREEKQERTWRMGRSGVGIALNHDFGIGGQLRLSYRIEARQLEELDLGALIDGEPWSAMITSSDDLPSSFRAQDSFTGLFLLDLRDDPVMPTKGGLVRILGEISTGLFQGLTPEVEPASFGKVQARAALVLPLGGIRLRTTLDMGYAQVIGTGIVPMEDRFRLGGTGSMRGFPRDGVGPKNQVSQIDVDWPQSLAPAVENGAPETRWVPTGGDTFAAAIIELDVPFPALGLLGWDRFSWVTFADLGNVWLLDPEAVVTSTQSPTTDTFDPLVRIGAGMGLRIATPVGPLQLDLAANPQAIASTGALRTLLVDTWEEPYLRVHLALGTLW